MANYYSNSPTKYPPLVAPTYGPPPTAYQQARIANYQSRSGVPNQTQPVGAPSYSQGFNFQPNQGMGQSATYATPAIPNYGGLNDPTLAPGASYSGGGGGGAIPPGAVPFDPMNSGNVNLMVGKGYRKKFMNGSWYWLPPGTPQGTPNYQPF